MWSGQEDVKCRHGEEINSHARAHNSMFEVHCGAPLVVVDRWKPPQRTINLAASKGAQCATYLLLQLQSSIRCGESMLLQNRGREQ